MQEYAKALRDKGGLSIVPQLFRMRCPPKDFPLQQFFSRKMTDQEIDYWFTRQTPCNIAVVCGEVSGRLLIVDFDDLTAFDAWQRQVSLPTLMVQTARGRHCYYRLKKGDYPSREGDFAFGDCEKAGQVLWNNHVATCPPSIHYKSGRPFVWLKKPILEISFAWLGLQFPARAPAVPKPAEGEIVHLQRYAEKALTEEMQEIMRMPPDSGRHNRLLKGAVKLQKYVGVLAWEEIARGLITAGMTAGLTEREARSTVEWARRHPPTDAGAFAARTANR